MRKILLGAILCVAMVGCGTQSTPVTKTNVAPDMQSILATYALTPITTTGSNLLGNGGFENGLTAWTSCGANVLSKSSDAQAGSGAAKLSDCMFQSVNVEVGKKYTLSCYVKETVDSGWTGIGFNFENADWEIVNEQLSVEVRSDSYTKYSISRRAPETAAYAAMWAYSDGTALIDTCEIVEGDTATTPMTPILPPVLPPAPINPTPVAPTPVGPITPMPPTPTTPVAPITPVTPAPPSPPAPVTPVAPNSITDIAIGAGLSKLVAALQLTNLDAVLADASGGPYTVFAPTDAAFHTLLDMLGMTFEELATDADLVKEILLYHVIADDLSLEILTEAQAMGDTRFETLQAAEDIDFGVFNGTLYLDDRSGRKIATLQSDVMASNGVVHVIDSVLLPPSVQEALLGY